MRNAPHSKNCLNEQGIYPCPVCRCGQITVLPLMEAMSCNFCNHIFTTNFEQQLLKLADSQPSLTWRWNGKTWKGLQHPGLQLGWDYLIVAIAFVVLPTAIVGCSAYLFPPIPGTPLAWLPSVWILLTFMAHLACVAWLAVEYYQLPILLYFRAIGRRLFNLRLM
ncbi:hypothetical protein IQ249_03155 [Lusitaniella coriacea LEGE 07157]|uniref:Uncharacterized protein n=1 Tax=Lusitaniella coriacea LEGE 07157 TaxID=945747 RepID=A0A8J7AN80_9CYAN|nr:hypothetical protein [Lusitaniella coriacea]MBE9114888.1 hypothetical protein [Lusitaniella coriacea LEGE 07157]